MHVCHMCGGACEDQERVLDPLKLELQEVMNVGPLEELASPFNYQTSSLAPPGGRVGNFKRLVSK